MIYAFTHYHMEAFQELVDFFWQMSEVALLIGEAEKYLPAIQD